MQGYSFLLLILALLPLPLSPFIARWADRSEAARSTMDSFVAVTLGGIVFLYIWPEAYERFGAAAIAVGLLGFALPFLFHGQFHHHEERVFPSLIWLAFLGLALHALLDGVALFSPDSDPRPGHSGAALLAVAVVLHRFPTALAIWWLVTPRLGRRSATLLLAIVGGATIVGFGLAESFLGRLSVPGLAAFEAGVAGMLMHIVFGHEHRHAKTPARADSRRTSAAGALAGIVLLAAVSRIHPIEVLPGELSGAVPLWIRVLVPPLLLGVLVWTLRARRIRN